MKTLLLIERANLNTILAFVMPSVMGFILWLTQRHLTARALRKAEAQKAAAEEKLRVETEEKERLKREHENVLERLKELEEQGSTATRTLASLEKDMLPIAEAMKRKMIEVLTHPSDEFEIPDALLARVKEIGAPMPPELLPMLKERETSTNPHVTEQEKLAAEALPILVRLAELEAQTADTELVTSIQMVSSTAKTPATKQREEEDEA